MFNIWPPVTGPATLIGKAHLEGRTDASSSTTQLTVTIDGDEYLIEDAPVALEEITAEWFVYTATFTIADLTPGAYDIKVKGLHTLRNVKFGVELTAGDNEVDFGFLLEGDCNNDNKIFGADFSLLRTTYHGDFDERCDLNEDSAIDEADLALLQDNYYKFGDIDVTEIVY
jgi:hypothetical protein